MLIRDLLEFAAERYPAWPAIVDGERRYTYGEWYGRVRRVAAMLWELGVRPGERVVQLLKNREENCTVHFACQLVAAVNTPLNFRWASGEVAYAVNDAEPKVVVFEAATAPAVLQARAQFAGSPWLVYVGEAPRTRPSRSRRRWRPRPAGRRRWTWPKVP